MKPQRGRFCAVLPHRGHRHRAPSGRSRPGHPHRLVSGCARHRHLRMVSDVGLALGGQLDAGRLRGRADRRQHGQRLHQQPHGDHLQGTVIPITIAAFAAYAFAGCASPSAARSYGRGRAPGHAPADGAVAGQIYKALTDIGIPMSQSFPGVSPGAVRPSVCHWQCSCSTTSSASCPRCCFETASNSTAPRLFMFTKVVLPLSVPALAASPSSDSCGSGTTCSWPWSSSERSEIGHGFSCSDSSVVAAASGTCCTAGAFVTMIVPMVVFLLLAASCGASFPARSRSSEGPVEDRSLGHVARTRPRAGQPTACDATSSGSCCRHSRALSRPTGCCVAWLRVTPTV